MFPTWPTIAAMKQPKRQPVTARLYIKEWREHLGLTLEQVGERLGVARGQVSKWELEQHRLNPLKIANLEAAMDLPRGSFHQPPHRRSLDALVADIDDQFYNTVADVVERLVKGRPN